MGKRLIIKNANFAENAIGEVTIPKLTDLLTPLVVGAAWYVKRSSTHPREVPVRTTDNMARASTTDIINISEWAPYIGTVNLTPKEGYKIAVYFGNKGTDDNLFTWGYTNSGETLTVNLSTVSYALVMVASNDNSQLTSTDWDTYVTET